MKTDSDRQKDTFASGSRPVTVYMACSPGNNRWGGEQWTAAGVVTVRGAVRRQPGIQVQRSADGSCRTFQWDGLKISLNQQSCAAYHENLTATETRVFVICRRDGDGVPTPFLVTLDFTEAEAYLEGGDEVYSTTPDARIYLWMEEFVVSRYKPQIPKKRKREAWFDNQKAGCDNRDKSR